MKAFEKITITDEGHRFLMRGLNAEELSGLFNHVSLEKLLAAAVEDENYGVAALIRDRLEELR